ncbi:hypothetical protein AAFF_G00274700 [Aldrovandia affinis]|uniref:Uncharacterized protein n=1 Tax=Aldrovandia affinis TaxID=143900 RepID=A0AAD7ST10_9TELE|nr:hypothetical protein AAFF_G00274700 [Aldrovandia affinis]
MDVPPRVNDEFLAIVAPFPGPRARTTSLLPLRVVSGNPQRPRSYRDARRPCGRAEDPGNSAVHHNYHFGLLICPRGGAW